MPIFDYECKRCGHKEEMIVKDYMQQVLCPECKKSLMQRLVCSPTFRLYGDGFYKPNKK